MNGINVKNYSLKKLRSKISMVPQKSVLFTGSISDNICWEKKNASQEEIIDAAKTAQADEFIKELPDGYNRQLLTIARVMLVNAPMLILDDATSNIDTITELKIQKAFIKMLKGRTSFIIAHRLSTIKESDIILVMDNGNIVQSGTHDELLEKGGQYSRLYNSQFATV
ncbi:ATP-binding cassette domain-containing protein [uncultured Clostridium sp.]|uniref:ATP-binding cassette domain-containing protein n=1 Tax=uncultured Clostridium sp. TaxID=59620 RepID=UPI002637AD54|nr:ATP-binding cassette domain-containing protein [uncultured Clostridium sp.]